MARVRDTGRFKQFRRGIAQLDEEGVVQVLRDPDLGRPGPDPGRRRADAVRGGGRTGSSNEFGAPVELSPTAYHVARRTDAASAAALRRCTACACSAGPTAAARAVREPYWLARVEADHPELTLDRLVAEGTAG